VRSSPPLPLFLPSPRQMGRLHHNQPTLRSTDRLYLADTSLFPLHSCFSFSRMRPFVASSFLADSDSVGSVFFQANLPTPVTAPPVEQHPHLHSTLVRRTIDEENGALDFDEAVRREVSFSSLTSSPSSSAFANPRCDVFRRMRLPLHSLTPYHTSRNTHRHFSLFPHFARLRRSVRFEVPSHPARHSH
jgi:hypothetical protein